MFRVRILASSIPLILAGVFAHSELAPGPRPCIAVGDHSVQIASSPWQAQLHVGFTDDPALATVRVQIVDSAEAADFAVVDDADNAETGACKATAATLLVTVASSSKASDPVIYLTRENDADYRIFVRSRSFTARDAAALVVGAGDGHAPVTTASVGGRS